MFVKSLEHLLNLENVKVRAKNGKQPVKVYRGEELKTLAASMGYTTSSNAGRTGIKKEELPEALQKFIVKGTK